MTPIKAFIRAWQFFLKHNLSLFTYRKANVDDSICCDETASIVVRVDMFRFIHEVENTFNQKWLCEAKAIICQTRDNASEVVPLEVRDEGPEQCVGSVLIGCEKMSTVFDRRE